MRFVPKLPSLWHRLVCFVVTATLQHEVLDLNRNRISDPGSLWCIDCVDVIGFAWQDHG